MINSNLFSHGNLGSKASKDDCAASDVCTPGPEWGSIFFWELLPSLFLEIDCYLSFMAFGCWLLMAVSFCGFWLLNKARRLTPRKTLLAQKKRRQEDRGTMQTNEHANGFWLLLMEMRINRATRVKARKEGRSKKLPSWTLAVAPAESWL